MRSAACCYQVASHAWISTFSVAHAGQLLPIIATFTERLLRG